MKQVVVEESLEGGAGAGEGAEDEAGAGEDFSPVTELRFVSLLCVGNSGMMMSFSNHILNFSSRMWSSGKNV
jgi:hypothetical protein